MTHSEATALQGQEARILLTNVCNYRCLFCHGEGVGDVTQSLWKPSVNATLDSVEQLINHGCRDITLTGGEPLICKDLALEVIRRTASQAPDAKVTIVSNLALLTDEWLRQAALHRNLRINVSLHTSVPEQYQRITGQQRTTVDHIREKLAWLRDADVPFKINCVALRSLAKENHFSDLCTLAEEAGATSLKILELLIMESSEPLFVDYLSLSSVTKLLPPHFEFVRKHPRRSEYESPRSQLTIELQKCRCRHGCRNCLAERTANVSSSGAYWPCFEGSNASFEITDGRLSSTLVRGQEVLAQMAERYGEQSPSLVKDTRLMKRKREAFFRVKDENCLVSFLEQAQKTEMIAFSDTYFGPLHHRGMSTQVAKIRCHDSDPENALLVLSIVWTENELEIPITAQQFLQDKPLPVRAKAEIIESILNHLNWRQRFKVYISGAFYELDGDKVFSICEVGHVGSVVCVPCNNSQGISLAQEFLTVPGLIPIKDTFPEYLSIQLR